MTARDVIDSQKNGRSMEP